MGYIYALIMLLAVFLLRICGAASEDAPTPAVDIGSVAANGCGGPVSNGASTLNLTLEGEVRQYRVFVPGGYDESTPAPVVLNFHGFGSNAESQEQYSGLADVAEAEGFLLVTPEAIGTPRHWHVWGDLDWEDVDDVAFVAAILDDLDKRFCVEGTRIYAAGISNGAAMVSLLACRLEGRLAAAAFVSGAAFWDECDGTDALPVLAFHGTADFLVPFEGSPLGMRPAMAEIIERWAAHNACGPVPEQSTVAADVTRLSFRACEQDVEFYIINGGGHTWPGTRKPKPFYGRTTQTISAAEIIWDFFSRERLP